MKTPDSPILFIVDEDPVYRQVTEQYLNFSGYTETLTFSTTDDCIRYLDLYPEIIISEYPENEKSLNGKAFLDHIKKKSPETLVIFLTSRDDLQSAVHSMTSGAVDYILKSKSAHTKMIGRLNSIYRYKGEMQKINEASKKLFASLCILLLLTGGLVAIYNW